MQLDALREVANVGCGHAATALSRLVGGRRVAVDVPRVWVRPADEVLAGRYIVARFGMEGDLTGQLMLVLAEGDARRLSELLLNAPSTGALSEPQKSALSEASNIVASACLSAIGGLTGQRLVPSIPTIRLGEAAEMLESARSVLVLEATFVAHLSPPIPGRLLVVPDPPSLKKLLARLGV